MTDGNIGRHRGGQRSSNNQRKVAVALLAAAVVGSAAATAWAVSAANTPTDQPSTTLAASPTAEEPAGDSGADALAATADPADAAADEPEADAPGDAGEEADADAEEPAATPTMPAELTACEEAVAVAEDTISTARSGIGHWTEHINARTDLLAGKITIDETNAIFKRTKLAGPDDVEAFDGAYQDYEQVADACADITVTAIDSEFADHAEACLARADAADKAVAAASDVIDDWRSHLSAMRRHADGDMTSSMARDQWIDAWRAAPPVLEAFAHRDASLEDAPACA